MGREKVRPICVLKQLWADLFDENCVNITNPDDGYQGLLMLIETALSRTKYISASHLSLKTTCEKHIAELDWKTQECNKLKAEVNRLETTKCHKCSVLEKELLHYKKKSFEAQNRIKSIANILKLGDNIEELEGQRRNSAMTLVSQMLLEESPKRKKRKINLSNNTASPPFKKNVIADNCGDVIPETSSFPDFTEPTTPVENLEKTDIITSPGEEIDILKSPGGCAIFNVPKVRTIKSINLPVTSIRRSPKSVKKNLTSEFQREKILEKSPPRKLKFNKQCHDQLSLNGSLVDYVKEANSELDKIWFNDETSNPIRKKKNRNNEISNSDEVLNATSHQKVSKNSVWKMEDVRGPSEVSGNKRLRQMKLNLSVKNKEVDLSSLEGYDGGSSADTDKAQAASNSGKVKDNTFEPKEIETPYSEDFKPEATSTQKNKEHGKKNSDIPKTARSPNYKYKRDAVRKRAERMKLDGWDCVNCAEYYRAACLSPSKVKTRMNKCSRHRDKFGQFNQTPPDYWNPLFPDTEECREKRLYVSIHCPKGDEERD